MDTAVKCPVTDQVKLSFVIFDIQASAWMSKITNDSLTRSVTGHYSCTHMATVGVKGLKLKPDEFFMIHGPPDVSDGEFWGLFWGYFVLCFQQCDNYRITHQLRQVTVS